MRRYWLLIATLAVLTCGTVAVLMLRQPSLSIDRLVAAADAGDLDVVTPAIRRYRAQTDGKP